MNVESFTPGKNFLPTPERTERVVLVVVPAGAVLRDITGLGKKGVPVHDEPVTVEFAYGENEMALADYKYSAGAYHLVKKYDTNVHWPDTVPELVGPAPEWPRERVEQRERGVPFLVKNVDRILVSPQISQAAEPAQITPPALPPPPPENPPAPPTLPTPPRDSVEEERELELFDRYWRLVAQVEDSQLKLGQARLTGQNDQIPMQQRRLEVGQKNLALFLTNHPGYRDLPKPAEIPNINLATAEGREQARNLILQSKIPAVEAGKRILATHKADLKLDLSHPNLDTGVGTSAVRPPLRTVLTDLKEAQDLVGRLNSLGLFSQLQNGERRHNNLLRLKSTRQSLEYILRRFSPPPHTDPNLSRDFLALLHSVVDATKKLEQGTASNFLSRWWSQKEMTEQNKKIGQGLKKLDEFTKEHKEFA